jgi:hypothetical protein
VVQRVRRCEGLAVRAVKGYSPSRKCQTFAMCGTGSDSKAVEKSATNAPEVRHWCRSLTCEKLQRMWPLMRIGEKEVV